MKRLLVAGLCLICTSAIAEPHKIAMDAKLCWSMPAKVQVDPPEYDVTLKVTFNDSGNVKDVNAVEFSPDTELVRLAVTSFARAIERCNRRTDYRGDIVIDMPSIEEMFKEDSIDPFK